jgi:hypothetical protein
MDYLRAKTITAEDDNDLNRAYEYSQELYQVIYAKKDQILQYDAGESNPNSD